MSKPLPTRIRCKGYTAPPYDGELLGTVAPGTYLGPVSTWLHTERCTTVLINDWWVNVWESRDGDLGTAFAYLVPDNVIEAWREQGWVVMELS